MKNNAVIIGGLKPTSNANIVNVMLVQEAYDSNNTVGTLLRTVPGFKGHKRITWANVGVAEGLKVGDNISEKFNMDLKIVVREQSVPFTPNQVAKFKPATESEPARFCLDENGNKIYRRCFLVQEGGTEKVSIMDKTYVIDSNDVKIATKSYSDEVVPAKAIEAATVRINQNELS